MRRRLTALAIATMAVGTSLGIGAVTAKHVQALNNVGCVPSSGAAPECPTIEGWGIGFGPINGGCATSKVSACYATGQCYAVPKGVPVTPGGAEGGGAVSVGQTQVGPLTVGPVTEDIPAFNVPANTAAGGVGACTSAPDQSGGSTMTAGDLTPRVSANVCQQLYAQTATISSTGQVTSQWVAYGTSLCSSMSGTIAAGAEAFQLYPNVPATGSGTWVNNQPSQVYTGLYDSVVRVFGTVDGVAIPVSGCDQGASACANDIFAV